MTSIKRLALALYLALCFSSLSNAQVTVNPSTSVVTQTHTMGDDSYVNVPLQFGFPFYGQTFNDSWMYDNGVVSFVNPTQQGALPPWQWNSQPIDTMTGRNYFIAPLWTDLYPVPGTSNYITEGDNTYQKYTWNNLAEYYSGGTRFNTFSLTIKSDGSIKSTYSALNITQSNVSVGMIGNSSNPQEKKSIYFSNAGTVVSTSTIQNWERTTYGVDPCSIDPLYSSTCPGYQQAYFDQQCSIDPLYDNQCPGYQQAYTNLQCSMNPLYDVFCPGYQQAYFDQQCSFNSLYNNQCPGYAQAIALKQLQEQQTKQEEPVEQAVQVTEPTLSSSNVDVAVLDPTRTETVVAVDVGGVELSISGEISIPTGQTSAAKEAVKEVEKEEVTKKEEEKKKPDPRAVSLALSAAREAEKVAQSVSEDAVTISQEMSVSGIGPGLGTGITLQNFRSLDSNETMNEENSSQTQSQSRTQSMIANQNNSSTVQTVETTQSTGSSVRGGGAVEGLSGGPDPALLARAPLDFNQYLNSQLRDAQFYQQREIYRGQQNVDNQRLLRGLSGGSDRLYQRMIDQQYNTPAQ
jgi:hypothetical protein